MSVKKSKGFTLIELLVVIAIIGMLSTIVLASLSQAHLKSIDAKKEEEIGSVQKALALFYSTYNRMPANYLVNGVPANACDDNSDPSQSAYLAAMQELVDAHDLASIPRTPQGSVHYCYEDFGPHTAIGAMFWTQLSFHPSNTGSCTDWLAYGDMNGDGEVDARDVTAWLAARGAQSPINNTTDFNRDGKLDLANDYPYVNGKTTDVPPCSSKANTTNDFCSCVQY